MSETITESRPSGVDPRSPGGSDRRWTRLLSLAGAVLALLLLGAALGMSLQRGVAALPQPEGSSVDIGFAQDMSVHHRQAVLMAGLARERSTDPEIRSLAFDIETSQLEQVGWMQGWLSLWDAAPMPTSRYMTWMAAGSMPGMAHGGGDAAGVAVMPGMASPDDLKRLQASDGAQFDVLFLQLMLRHHQGGVPMATYTAQHAETPQVRNLADKIVISQGAESGYLTQLITQRGAQPLPS
ncbi:MAG: DUF305 domain-containing protein [Pseudonocardiaceae bacterium]